MTLPRLRVVLLVLLCLPLGLALTLSLTGCSTLRTISINPGSGVMVLSAVGQTAQFNAVGASQMGSAAATTSDITNAVTWSVTNTNVAKIDANGLATALGAGHTQITAQANGLVATSDLTVNISASASPTLSLSPSSATETFTGETTQFLATGNLTGSGSGQNLNSQVQWISSNSQVATVNANGLATATGPGTTTITAYYGSLVATATVTVAVNSNNPGSPNLTVSPGSATDTLLGQTTQFLATGNLTGSGTQQNLTTQVQWVSSNAQVATITAGGLATAVGPGTTTITAVSGGLTASATITVTASSNAPGTPTLTVTPSTMTQTFTGETTQFVATGSLTGAGSIQNLTTQVQWSSSSPQIATVNATGLVTAAGAGTTTIFAASGGLMATATVTVATSSSNPGVPTLTVNPRDVTDTLIGETTQFIATGTLTGAGTVQDLTGQVQWSSSNVQVATITAKGIATTVGVGATTITAQSGGLVASVTLTVAASSTAPGTPTLTVSPGSMTDTFIGETTQFIAAGTLTGLGSIQNLTTQVQWTSSNPQVATVNAVGQATAVGAGTTTIAAQSGGLIATANLIVATSSSAPGVPTLSVNPGNVTDTLIGEATQFIATGNLTGAGTVQDLTGKVQWSSSNAQVATITAAGIATTVGVGTTTIIAQSGGLVATATLTVAASSTAPGTPTLTVSPGSMIHTYAGETTQFIATGTLTGIGSIQDLTTQVQWTSSNPQVATVSAAGQATAVGPGTTIIAAQSGGLVANATLTVATSSSAPGVPTLSVNPGDATDTLLGETTQFVATGTLTGAGAIQDLSNQVQWTSANPQVATITTAGIATAVGAGTTTITAQAGGLVANATLTVVATSTVPGSPTLTVSPNTMTQTFTGETTQFVATGTLTGLGSIQDLTSKVQWSSSNTQIATISAGGKATAVGAGTTIITAQSGGLTSTATLTVAVSSTTPGTPTLTIIPGAVNASAAGAVAQLVAIGNLTGNGPVQNLTNNVAWISSSTSVATVTQAGLATSMVTPPAGVSYSTTITAIGVTGNSSVITSTILFTVTGVPAQTPPNETLAVFEVGSGTGTIAGSGTPPGTINCGNGGTVCGETVPQGTVITLTATPAAGSTFAGWTGNCVTSTPTSCVVTMSTNQTIGATFN